MYPYSIINAKQGPNNNEGTDIIPWNFPAIVKGNDILQHTDKYVIINDYI